MWLENLDKKQLKYLFTCISLSLFFFPNNGVPLFSLIAKIHYKPALPSQREFLTQNMPVGHMMKFIITYQKVSKWR